MHANAIGSLAISRGLRVTPDNVDAEGVILDGSIPGRAQSPKWNALHWARIIDDDAWNSCVRFFAAFRQRVDADLAKGLKLTYWCDFDTLKVTAQQKHMQIEAPTLDQVTYVRRHARLIGLGATLVLICMFFPWSSRAPEQLRGGITPEEASMSVKAFLRANRAPLPIHVTPSPSTAKWAVNWVAGPESTYLADTAPPPLFVAGIP